MDASTPHQQPRPTQGPRQNSRPQPIIRHATPTNPRGTTATGPDRLPPHPVCNPIRPLQNPTHRNLAGNRCATPPRPTNRRPPATYPIKPRNPASHCPPPTGDSPPSADRKRRSPEGALARLHDGTRIQHHARKRRKSHQNPRRRTFRNAPPDPPEIRIDPLHG